MKKFLNCNITWKNRREIKLDNDEILLADRNQAIFDIAKVGDTVRLVKDGKSKKATLQWKGERSEGERVELAIVGGISEKYLFCKDAKTYRDIRVRRELVDFEIYVGGFVSFDIAKAECGRFEGINVKYEKNEEITEKTRKHFGMVIKNGDGTCTIKLLGDKSSGYYPIHIQKLHLGLTCHFKVNDFVEFEFVEASEKHSNSNRVAVNLRKIPRKEVFPDKKKVKQNYNGEIVSTVKRDVMVVKITEVFDDENKMVKSGEVGIHGTHLILNHYNRPTYHDLKEGDKIKFALISNTTPHQTPLAIMCERITIDDTEFESDEDLFSSFVDAI